MRSTKPKTKSVTSHPPIPDGLVPMREWAISRKLTPVCVQRWIYAGKLRAYRIPGHGFRNFIKPDEAERCLRPVSVAPTLAR